MKYKKNVISNLILQITTIVIGFATSIIIARSLGVEKQGMFSYFLLIFGIISSYGDLSINSSNSYFMKKSEFNKKDVINNNISLLIIFSIIYAFLVIIFRKNIFIDNYYIFSLIWFIYAIALMFVNYFLTVYLIDENIYIYNRFILVSNVTKGILLISLFFFNCLNLLTISIIYSIIEIIKLLFVLFNLKIKYNFKISKKIIYKELKYGIPLYLAALFIYLNYRADLFMVKNMLNDSQLGVYSIAVHLAELAFILPGAFTTAFEGKLYACKIDERKRITADTIKICFYSTLAICIIGIICKPLVVILYGKEYVSSGNAMIILLLGIIFASIGKIAPAFFYTMGRPKVHMIVSFIVFVINIILNYFLIPKIGINGAAVASTISYTSYGLIYIVLLSKEKINIKQIFLIKKEDFKKFKNVILYKK